MIVRIRDCLSLKAVKNTLSLGAVFVCLGFVFQAQESSADEADAKKIFKNMSDYMSKQPAIAFDIDTSLEVVTKDEQKLAITNSGSVSMQRPGKIFVSRKGGFSDVQLIFDGKVLSFLQKEDNEYAQLQFAGSIDNLIEELRNKYHRPLPAADLLATDVYNEMMPLVNDIKDLGTGYIRGIECDHLAFRTEDVDWQIWISRGERPVPVRYSVSSIKVTGHPQYQVDILNFQSGPNIETAKFNFSAPSGAKLVSAAELKNFDELPEFFKPR